MPVENGRPQADCFPRAFLVLPDMRRQPLSERPQGLEPARRPVPIPFPTCSRENERSGREAASPQGWIFPGRFSRSHGYAATAAKRKAARP